jgi:hypothetical protein
MNSSNSNNYRKSPFGKNDTSPLNVYKRNRQSLDDHKDNSNYYSTFEQVKESRDDNPTNWNEDKVSYSN